MSEIAGMGSQCADPISDHGGSGARLKCRRTGKREFATKQNALEAALGITKRSDKAWRPYQCEFCANWHLTTRRLRRT